MTRNERCLTETARIIVRSKGKAGTQHFDCNERSKFFDGKNKRRGETWILVATDWPCRPVCRRSDLNLGRFKGMWEQDRRERSGSPLSQRWGQFGCPAGTQHVALGQRRDCVDCGECPSIRCKGFKMIVKNELRGNCSRQRGCKREERAVSPVVSPPVGLSSE